MTPRTYLTQKQTQTTVLRSITNPEPREIPLDTRLYDLKDASILLTNQFGKGYSIQAMRRLIKSGEWVEGWHYRKRGKIFKIYLAAVQEWQLRG